MSEPTNDFIRVDVRPDGLAVLTIDRAAHFNTLSAETLREFVSRLETLKSDGGIRALVIHGDGGESFAAGANIREIAQLTPRSALAFSALGGRLFELLEESSFVVYAAIDGYCLGGGLDLALACDIRIASPRSIFGHPGATLGIITGFGGTARLPRLVGRAAALELFVTAGRIDAMEALRIRLVDAVVDDPVAVAIERARLVAVASPSATAKPRD